MSIFSYIDNEAIGRVVSADTVSVTICVHSIECLQRLQVNQLTVIHSSKPGRYLIGLISKVVKQDLFVDNYMNRYYDKDHSSHHGMNFATIRLIGTYYNRIGYDENMFHRTLEVIPEIDSLCFLLEGRRLGNFMKNVSGESFGETKLRIGRFILHDNTIAYLNGNRLFQRHVMIAGSTGSGKSWTTARLLEQISNLQNPNAVLFDIHGEYNLFSSNGSNKFRRLRVANASDKEEGLGLRDGVLHLPYWMLDYEDLVSLSGIRTVRLISNQETLFRQRVLYEKRAKLKDEGYTESIKYCTADSPIPFRIKSIVDYLRLKNVEREAGEKENTTRRGPYAGQLTSLIDRLEAMMEDPRLAFLFDPPDECFDMHWLPNMIQQLSTNCGTDADLGRCIKIIDFSSISSDLVPLVAKFISQTLFNTNRWMRNGDENPIVIFCDEANLYMSDSLPKTAVANDIFERIAKEGRKYGISLVVICQRPSDISSGVLSQCNNLVVMRLPYSSDQSSVRGVMTESFKSFNELLPSLGVGEAMIIGDSCILPTPIKIDPPSQVPEGETIEFWEHWKTKASNINPSKVALFWRFQHMHSYLEPSFKLAWCDRFEKSTCVFFPNSFKTNYRLHSKNKMEMASGEFYPGRRK